MRRIRWFVIVAAVMTIALVGVACGDDDADTGGSGSTLSGDIRIDGSSTVGPLTEAAAEMFQMENPDVRVTVGISGTGGGFEKFAAGETDISDASRPIKDEEAQALADAGIEYGEMTVAMDGLAVVVNPENDWADSLTVEQLNMIWDADSKIDNWNQVDPSFPDVPLELFGPGTDSGTFDYFTDVINGEEGVSRTDYLATEDDNVAVQGVAGSKGGMAYFGLSYYEQNTDTLKVLAIDGGSGPVTPSRETVQSGEYQPLSRPLFIYVKKESLERPEVAAFVQFYLDNLTQIAEQALFVPLTEEQTAESQAALDALLGS
jgi:phosphate transport system substrate-binding protein